MVSIRTEEVRALHSGDTNLNQDEVTETLSDREVSYGAYRDNSAIAQSIKQELHDSAMWEDMPPYIRETMDMIASKLSRLANGDPYHRDSWVDIMGYTQLVLDEFDRINSIDLEDAATRPTDS